MLVTGYSPFGGNGHAGATFANPSIQAVAAAHSVSAAQVVLRWNVQLGIPVIPQATDPNYQAGAYSNSSLRNNVLLNDCL